MMPRLKRRAQMSHRRPDRRGVVFGVTSLLSAKTLLVGQMQFLSRFGGATLICNGSDGAEIAASQGAGFREVSLGRNPSLWADLRGLWQLVQLLRSLRPQVSILGTPKMSLLGGIAAWGTRVPVRIYVMHGLRLEGAVGVTRWLLRLAEWCTCKLATHVVVVGRSLAETASSNRVVRPSKVTILGSGTANGVDRAYFRQPSAAERASARARFGWTECEEIAVFVGRITRDKGIRELAEAWPSIALYLPNARLILAGEKELSANVEGAFRRLTSRSDVTVLGHCDPRVLYWAADLLVLPTYREGLPTVVLEAAACGVPAITTHATGARDSVLHGVTGYLVPARDVDALVNGVVSLVKSRQASEFGAAGAARVAQLFDRQIVWSHWRELLLSLGVPESPEVVRDEARMFMSGSSTPPQLRPTCSGL